MIAVDSTKPETDNVNVKNWPDKTVKTKKIQQIKNNIPKIYNESLRRIDA
jgi:hypothetical protein